MRARVFLGSCPWSCRPRCSHCAGGVPVASVCAYKTSTCTAYRIALGQLAGAECAVDRRLRGVRGSVSSRVLK